MVPCRHSSRSDGHVDIECEKLDVCGFLTYKVDFVFIDTVNHLPLHTLAPHVVWWGDDNLSLRRLCLLHIKTP